MVHKNEDGFGSLCTVLFQLWNILVREWVYKNEDALGLLCTVLFQLWDILGRE